eukprot:12230548-Alexandrium_andersonii.AAC.1
MLNVDAPDAPPKREDTEVSCQASAWGGGRPDYPKSTPWPKSTARWRPTLEGAINGIECAWTFGLARRVKPSSWRTWSPCGRRGLAH